MNVTLLRHQSINLTTGVITEEPKVRYAWLLKRNDLDGLSDWFKINNSRQSRKV